MTPPPVTPDRPTPDDPQPGAVVLAAVAGAHGVAGEVRLKIFADDLSAFARFNAGTLTLTGLRDGSIARFAEIRDRTAAERLRGMLLTVMRDDLPALPDGEYYHADLIGLVAVTDAGDAAGRVVAVENFGAGDVIEIERPDAKRFMVPIQAVSGWDRETLTFAAAYAE